MSILVMIPLNRIKRSCLLKKAGEIQEILYLLVMKGKTAGLLFEHYVGCYTYVFDHFSEVVQSEQLTEQNAKITNWVYEEHLKEVEEKFWVTAGRYGRTDVGFGRIQDYSGKDKLFEYDF